MSPPGLDCKVFSDPVNADTQRNVSVTLSIIQNKEDLFPRLNIKLL